MEVSYVGCSYATKTNFKAGLIYNITIIGIGLLHAVGTFTPVLISPYMFFHKL